MPDAQVKNLGALAGKTLEALGKMYRTMWREGKKIEELIYTYVEKLIFVMRSRGRC